MMNKIITSMTELCSDHRFNKNKEILQDCYRYVMHRRPKKSLNYRFLLMGTGMAENKRGKKDVHV